MFPLITQRCYKPFWALESHVLVISVSVSELNDNPSKEIYLMYEDIQVTSKRLINRYLTVMDKEIWCK